MKLDISKEEKDEEAVATLKLVKHADSSITVICSFDNEAPDDSILSLEQDGTFSRLHLWSSTVDFGFKKGSGCSYRILESEA
jgi:hypothetical protein